MENKNYDELLRKSLLTIKNLKNQIAQGNVVQEKIAVIGMACRFPGGSDSPEQYWDFLKKGVASVIDVPEERWNINDYYDPNRGKSGKVYIKQESYLQRDIAEFDGKFFGISPAEANEMDPQQRFLYEVLWEALENAGQNVAELRGSNTGVFLGISSNGEYSKLPRDESKVNQYTGIGNSSSIASGRLSYTYGWNGPSISVDTACSSSLVSTHLAVHSLSNHECDLAVSAGVSFMISPEVMSSLCAMNALSPDGKSKPFDEAADGYGRGEGCGVVILKRLSDAVKDHDTIYAVIQGSALNNDGESSSLTVPNGKAQSQVIFDALKHAGISPDDVDYIETHGTGTMLGDPIEFEAIKDIFLTEKNNRDHDLMLGAVKGNIGHLEAAAGIASLIKVILSLYHKEVVPIANLKKLNPRICTDNLPVKLLTACEQWDNQKKRIAGVSSFGFSGTNAHIILSEGLNPSEHTIQLPKQILCLSGRTEKSIVELIKRYRDLFEEKNDLDLEEICYTANVCRPKFTNCAIFMGSGVKEFIDGFQKVLDLYEKTGHIYLILTELTGSSKGNDRLAAKRLIYKEISDSVYTASIDEMIQPKLAFVFHGEGTKIIRKARKLYEILPVFHDKLDQCFEQLREYKDKMQKQFLAVASTRKQEEKVSQLLLFTVEYALAEFLHDLGIHFEIACGEGTGDYVAAVTAGIMTYNTAVSCIVKEEKRRSEGSHYLKADASETVIRALLQGMKVRICAVYSNKMVVVLVMEEELEQVKQLLDGQSVSYEEIKGYWVTSLNLEKKIKIVKADIHKPAVRYMSTNTTRTLRSVEELYAQYSKERYNSPIRYQDCLEALYQQGYRFFVEFGENPDKAIHTNIILNHEDAMVLDVMNDKEEFQGLLGLIARCISLGSKVDWMRFYEKLDMSKVPLPNYPFERNRYWITPPEQKNGGFESMPLSSDKFKAHEMILPFASRQYKFLFSNDNFQELLDNSGVIHMGYYLEMIQNVMSQAYPDSEYTIDEMEFMSAIMIFEDERKEVLIVLDTEEADKVSFKIFNKNIAQKKWNQNMRGKISIVFTQNDSQVCSLSEMKQSCMGKEIDSAAFYEPLEKERGFYFGHAVRFVDKVWSNGTDAFVAFRNMDEDDVRIEYNIGIHPGILDSCAQTCNFLAVGHTPDGKKYMVKKMSDIIIQPEHYNDDALFAKICFQGFDGEKNEIKASIGVYNQIGELIVQITGIELKEFDEKQLGLMKTIMDSANHQGSKDNHFLMKFKQASTDRKLALLTDYVSTIMADVLECKLEELDIYEPIENLGLDSMNGLDFYNKTTELLGVEMPFSELAQCKNLAVAIEHIKHLLLGEKDSDTFIEEDAEPDMSIERWIFEYKENRDAKARIFCFPNGFRSADMFKSWQEQLGPDIQVCAIKIPGMDMQRISEKAPVYVDEFIETLVEVLDEEGLLNVPCTSFGHSWGSLFSYRLAYCLMKRKAVKYVKLFVSGYTSPAIKNSSIVKILDEIRHQGFHNIPNYDDIKNNKEAIDLLVKSYQKVWDYDEKGTKAVLQLLLAACGLIDRFEFKPEEVVDMPIVGFHGIDDYVVEIDEMNQWESLTKDEFRLYTLKGDHQFVNENQSEKQLLEIIKKEIETAL